MSAIYGIIDLNRKAVSEDTMLLFSNKFDKYKIDRQVNKVKDNVGLGCGIQYFNRESKYELLPIIEDDYAFTADCIIDNRDELIEIFNKDAKAKDLLDKYTDKESGIIPDGSLLYIGFLKWGRDCAKHMRGVFSYVAYDYKKNEVTLCVDQFACRCLHYMVKDNVVYFSTNLFPLIEYYPGELKKNDRWLLDSVSVRATVMMIEPEETAIEGVKKVVSGSYVTIATNKNNGLNTNTNDTLIESDILINKTRYYNPQKDIKTDNSITPEKANSIIRERMINSVKGCIRDGVEIGAQLSQGLDSSTVACIAAPMVETKGKKLYTFTSVPLEEAELPTTGYHVYNERPGVEKILAMYPVMEASFLDTKGRDILHEADMVIEAWGLPSKSQQNAIWGMGIYEAAANKGCRVLLTGATGNCTVSAGYQENLILHYLTHLRLIKASKLVQAIAETYNVSRKKILKTTIKSYLSYYYAADKRRQNDKKNEDKKDINKNYIRIYGIYADNITDIAKGEAYNCQKRISMFMKEKAPYTNTKEHRRQAYMELANAQIGEVDTNYSLMYGVVPRDPMRNVEVVDACMSLPLTAYIGADYDRRLIRVGMEGIVPEEILKDVSHRGSQSGDNTYRIARAWDDMQPDIKDALHSHIARQYLDMDKVDQLFNKLNADNLYDYEMDTRMIIDAYIWIKYIMRLENSLK